MPDDTPPPEGAAGDDLWNALSLRRTLPTEMVPLSKLKRAPWMTATPDTKFVHLFGEYLDGKRNLFATRMSLDRLKCGDYRPESDGTLTYRCDKPPHEDIAQLASSIREGHRPPIYIYKNPNTSDAERYLAPDDVAVFRAYEMLGVRKVPVVSLSKPTGKLEESAYELRGFRTTGNNRVAHIVNVLPGVSGSVPAFVGAKTPEATIPSLQVLRQRIARTQAALKRFHVAGERIHYHHTLYSTLYRLDETLQGVTALLERDMWYQAVPLLRSLYETALMFYLDWLAPEQMGTFLALAAVLDNEGLRKLVKSTSTVERNGKTFVDGGIEKAVAGTFELLRNVRRKAEISPLGTRFYENMYSFMSRVAHQDFEIVANFAQTLERPERPKLADRTMVSLLLSADVIVAMVVLRIDDDIRAQDATAEGPSGIDAGT